jgi:hypothetical protein
MHIIKKKSDKFTLVFLYGVIGILWVMLSDDALLYFVKDIENLSTYQSYKGWAYVLLTSLLLYILLQWYEKKLTQQYSLKIKQKKSSIYYMKMLLTRINLLMKMEIFLL